MSHQKLYSPLLLAQIYYISKLTNQDSFQATYKFFIGLILENSLITSVSTIIEINKDLIFQIIHIWGKLEYNCEG